jgi:hypothetical protein
VIASAAATAGVALAIATVVWGVRAARSGQLDRAAAVGLAATGPMIVVNFGLTNFGALAAGAGGVVLAGAWLFAAVRSAAQAVPAASTMYSRFPSGSRKENIGGTPG